MHISIFIHIYIHINVYIRMHIRLFVYTYICILFVYTYVCICIYVYIYICIFLNCNAFFPHLHAGPGMILIFCNNFAEMGPSAHTLGCLAQCAHACWHHSRPGQDRFASGSIL